MNEYFENKVECSPEVKLQVKDILSYLKTKVDRLDYQIFYDYYVNSLTLSELKEKYKLPFASSVSYIIKRCEKICRETDH